MPASLSIIPAIALLTFVVAAPDLAVRDGLYGYDGRRILELLFLTAGCAVVAISRQARARILAELSRNVTATAAALVFFGFGTAAAVLSVFPGEALLDVAVTAALALTALVCGLWGRERPTTFRILASAAVATSAAISIVQFSASFLGAAVAPTETIDLFPAYLTPRFFSQWQTWTLPLLGIPAALLSKSRVASRTAVAVVASCWWAIAFLSGGRGTLLSLAFAATCVVLAGGVPARRWLRSQAAVVAAGAAGAGALALVFPTVVAATSTIGRFLSADDSGRLALWGSAVRLAAESPITGIGPQHYAYAAGHDVAHPHNLLLQVAAEWGLPAAAALLVVLAFALRALSRGLSDAGQTSDEIIRTVRYALATSFLAALAHSFLSGLAIMPLSQAGACLVGAWLLAESRAHDGAQRTAGSAGVALQALSMAILTALLVLAAPAASHRIAHPIEGATADTLRFRPRMWRDAQTNFALPRVPAADTAPAHTDDM